MFILYICTFYPKSNFHDIYAIFLQHSACMMDTLHLAGALSCRHYTCIMGTVQKALCMQFGHSAAWALCNRHSSCSLDTLQHDHKATGALLSAKTLCSMGTLHVVCTLCNMGTLQLALRKTLYNRHSANTLGNLQHGHSATDTLHAPWALCVQHGTLQQALCMQLGHFAAWALCSRHFARIIALCNRHSACSLGTLQIGHSATGILHIGTVQSTHNRAARSGFFGCILQVPQVLRPQPGLRLPPPSFQSQFHLCISTLITDCYNQKKAFSHAVAIT
jgi:hypothetical protein